MLTRENLRLSNLLLLYLVGLPPTSPDSSDWLKGDYDPPRVQPKWFGVKSPSTNKADSSPTSTTRVLLIRSTSHDDPIMSIGSIP